MFSKINGAEVVDLNWSPVSHDLWGAFAQGAGAVLGRNGCGCDQRTGQAAPTTGALNRSRTDRVRGIREDQKNSRDYWKELNFMTLDHWTYPKEVL